MGRTRTHGNGREPLSLKGWGLAHIFNVYDNHDGFVVFFEDYLFGYRRDIGAILSLAGYGCVFDRPLCQSSLVLARASDFHVKSIV
jgi:hypothetical protein